ncbi:MAG: DPP IV N-terminal domain-containing protein [bacterium]|nr:DPP IV N-terminal domain-containing protein [bacterium]
MLLRAYRVTDKVGVVILKLSASLVDSTLQGISIIWRAFARLLAVLFAVLWFILKPMRLLVGAAGIGRARPVGAGAASSSMARRAARTQSDAGLREDPLKVQNRALNLLTLVLLGGLVVVIFWATNPSRNTAAPLVVDAGGFNAELFAADTPIPTQSGAGLIATPVSTATPLPAVLAARGAIAYTARERAQTDVWAVAVDGRTPVRLTNTPADERDPVWSPDGRRIAYAGRQDDNWELYVYDLAADSTSRLTFDLSFQGAPQWSPDGEFLVYESYQGNNLDVYIVRADGQETPIRLPSNSDAPDFSPTWKPDDGRQIAFVSWRDGSQDVYVFSLDDQSVVNVTNTPNRQEDDPVFSPDGRFIAYSALDEGLEKVFVVSAENIGAPAQVIGRGRTPAWSPDGQAVIAAVDSGDSTQLVAIPFGAAGVVTPVIQVQAGANDPSWTDVPLPAQLVNAGGLPPASTSALFIEQEQRLTIDPPYRLRAISANVDQPSLSERVDDSFNAMRETMLERAGWDVLGRLDDAFWEINRPPAPGEQVRSWFKSGRAVGLTRAAIIGSPPAYEIVREDIGVDTFWRVYVRVAENAQSGQLGEPLRHMPWDFQSRTSGDVEAYDQGGRLKTTMPDGYYIDLTQLALDFGWDRLPAGSDWRANINSVNYWLLVRTDGLDWYSAMREIYPEGQLVNFAPTSAPNTVDGTG